MYTVTFSCTTARMFYILIFRITVHLLRTFYIIGTHYCTIMTYVLELNYLCIL